MKGNLENAQKENLSCLHVVSVSRMRKTQIVGIMKKRRGEKHQSRVGKRRQVQIAYLFDAVSMPIRRTIHVFVNYLRGRANDLNQAGLRDFHHRNAPQTSGYLLLFAKTWQVFLNHNLLNIGVKMEGKGNFPQRSDEKISEVS